ncbi:hypothetical protein L6R52_41405, partial [Myxococcota bacterium]|nr:hypothetical protein [Myxococcota bacterium]
AKALAADDPSLFGLAFDVATFVFDAAAFAHGFRALGGHVERAIAASSPSELDEALTRVREAAIRAEGTVSGELAADAATASVLRARERAVLFAVHAPEAAELGARWGLDERAIAGLLRLDDTSRAVIVGLGDAKVIASLGRIADASDEAARGLSRLVRARPDDARTVIGELATTSSDRAAAILRRLGDARATEADVAAIAARRDGSSARDALRAIEAASAKDLPLSIADELALERRLRVPVDVDPTLPGREVRVVFEAKEGIVRDVRIVAGPRATGADLEAHGQVLDQLGRYRGLLGRATRLLDRAAERFGRGTVRPSTRAFEAKLELEKLPRLIEARQRELAGALDPARAAKVSREIASLQRQLAQHERAFAALDAGPGRGFVAATDPATELREALERTLALGPEHDVDVVAGALRIDGVAVRGEELVALAKRDPARAAAIVDVMKRVAAQGGRDALEGLTIDQLEKVADVFHARVAADFEAAMPAARALKQDVASHKALDRAIASAAKEERAARGLDAKPKQAAYVFDRGAALDAVAKRTDLTPEVIADLRESLTKIEDSGRFDRAGVDAVLRAIRDADDRGVAEYLAELKHGLHVLEQGRVADGTLVHFAVKNGAGVKLAGHRYVFDGTNGAGRVLISDADVLYLGKDGKVHVDEVKHTAKALREKLEGSSNYARDLAEWATSSAEPRAVSIAIAQERGWTELLAARKGSTESVLTTLWKSGAPVSVSGRQLDLEASAEAAVSLLARVDARRTAEKLTTREALAAELPRIPPALLVPESP